MQDVSFPSSHVMAQSFEPDIHFDLGVWFENVACMMLARYDINRWATLWRQTFV